jgi:hypothetical protein
MATVTLALWIAVGLTPFWLGAALFADWLQRRAGRELDDMTDTVAGDRDGGEA